MPLLTITTSASVAADEKRAFLDGLADRYAETMDSDTDYLAAELRTTDRESLRLGRASADGDALFLSADVRTGRSVERRRRFALAAIEYAEAELSVPERNQKVVFTEHEGSHMMGADRVGGDWSAE